MKRLINDFEQFRKITDTLLMNNNLTDKEFNLLIEALNGNISAHNLMFADEIYFAIVNYENTFVENEKFQQYLKENKNENLAVDLIGRMIEVLQGLDSLEFSSSFFVNQILDFMEEYI